jgi:hypothetical protein
LLINFDDVLGSEMKDETYEDLTREDRKGRCALYIDRMSGWKDIYYKTYPPTSEPKMMIMIVKSMRSRTDMYASEGTSFPTIARNKERRGGDGLDAAYATQSMFQLGRE